jgi:probable rRNA maturation factor
MNIVIVNRQRTQNINTRLLRQIVGELFGALKITEAELGINLVGTREMTLVNETFLHHAGSTDVITFDHTPGVPPAGGSAAKKSPRANRRRPALQTLHGELFVCVNDAILQAREFKTDWQSEVVRYIVHGVLHLLGHDDLKPQRRRAMKRAENRLVRRLARRFALAQLSRPARIAA